MNNYLVLVLCIVIGTHVLGVIVDILNLRHLRSSVPREFKSYCDPQKYADSQQYLKDNTRLSLFSDSVFSCLTVLFILFGGFDLVDRFARFFGRGEIITGLIFAGTLLFISHALHIPFRAYRTFVIEARYDFNRTKPGTFMLDILKVWILTAVIGGIVFSAVLWFFGKTGGWAWVYCWCTLTVVQVLLMFAAPVVILPLFNKFTPLADDSLRSAIKEYAASQHVALQGIFTMDGSRRSSKSNAFFAGFGKYRRIVLFDTLIAKHDPDELLSIIGHETGHYKKKHILTSLFLSSVTSGIMFFILSQLLYNQGMFDAFKMGHVSLYASLVFFGFLYAPIDLAAGIFSNMHSRRNEFEADAFAVKTCRQAEPLVRALKKLSVDNLSNLTPHPLKVFLSYSHPPVLERINKISRLQGLHQPPDAQELLSEVPAQGKALK